MTPTCDRLGTPLHLDVRVHLHFRGGCRFKKWLPRSVSSYTVTVGVWSPAASLEFLQPPPSSLERVRQRPDWHF